MSKDGDGFSRRATLAVLAGGTIGLAGCQGVLDDTEAGGDTSTPAPTPTETPTPTPTPEEDELLAPDSVDEAEWDEVLASIEGSVLTSEDSFVDTLTDNGEYTQTGEAVAELITDETVAEIQQEIAEAVTERGDALDEYDLAILEMLTANPQVSEPDTTLPTEAPAIDVFPETRLERTEAGLTEFEEQAILDLKDPDHDIPEQLLEARSQLLTPDGYDPEDIEMLNLIGEYITDTLNASYPRLEQVLDEGILEEITQTGQTGEQILEDISDPPENGVINRRDPSEDYSATPDPYPTGLLGDTFELDPEKPTMVYLVESTSDADDEMMEHALEFMPEMYGDDGFQVILIDGRQNLDPLPDNPSREGLGDRIRSRAPRQALTDLPAHYMLFTSFGRLSEGSPTRLYGLNGPVYGDQMSYAMINTTPPGASSDPINWDEETKNEWTIMAETFDNLYDSDERSRIDDWYRKWPEDVLSDEGKKSYSSWGYAHQGQIENKEMLDAEKEMVLESDLGIQIPSHRSDEVKSYQRDLLAENEDLDFDVDKDYVKRIPAEGLDLEI